MPAANPTSTESTGLEPLRAPSWLRSKDDRGSRLRQTLRILLSFGLGAAIGGGALGIARALSVTDALGGAGATGPLVLVPGVIATLFLVLLVHEGGHALTGRLAGLRLLTLVVGPLRLARKRGRLTLGLNRNLGYYGGVVVLAPTQWTDLARFRRGYLAMVAGGPLASLLGGVTALALRPSLAPDASTWGSLILIGGVASLGIAVVTLTPIRMPGGFMSDGGQLLRLAGSSDDARHRLMVTVLSLLALTQRPQDWDPQLVERALSLRGSADSEARTRLLAYHWALDRGDLAAAHTHLQRGLDLADRLTLPERASGALEAALFEALWRSDALAALAWMEHAPAAKALDPHGWQLAQAAIRRAQGDAPGASRALGASAAALRSCLVPEIALLHAGAVDLLAQESAPGSARRDTA